MFTPGHPCLHSAVSHFSTPIDTAASPPLLPSLGALALVTGAARAPAEHIVVTATAARVQPNLSATQPDAYFGCMASARLASTLWRRDAAAGAALPAAGAAAAAADAGADAPSPRLLRLRGGAFEDFAQTQQDNGEDMDALADMTQLTRIVDGARSPLDVVDGERGLSLHVHDKVVVHLPPVNDTVATDVNRIGYSLIHL